MRTITISVIEKDGRIQARMDSGNPGTENENGMVTRICHGVLAILEEMKPLGHGSGSTIEDAEIDLEIDKIKKGTE